VFFLLLVFYRGEWQARLQYILFLFIFAAVLIARIAMDEGRERAALFSVALAGAVGFTLNRFSDLGIVANCGLMALIWWCADRLTWDCTLIDEHENVSGEGLLQTVGLDQPSDSPQAARSDADVEPLGVTSRDEPPPPKSWWRQVWDHFHKPRAPGVWVIYFSIAALPIFGFGQRFIAGEEARQAAFRYLVIYVASALALLMSTCFLGLRRYLRQRRVEMPDKLAFVWVSTGCILIVALLLFCTILPRRNPVVDIAQSAPPVNFGSPGDLTASWLGWGEEGVKDDSQSGTASQSGQQEHGEQSNSDGHGQSGSSAGEANDQDSQQQNSSHDQANQSASSDSGSPGSAGSHGENPSSGQQPGSNPGHSQSQQDQGSSKPGGQTSQQSVSQHGQSQGNASHGAQSNDQRSASSQESSSGQHAQNDGSNEHGESRSDPSQEGSGQQHDQSGSQGSPRQGSSSHDAASKSDESSSMQSQEPPPSSPEASRPSFNPGAILGSLLGWLGTLFKLAFYVVVVIVGIWIARKYKDELLAGFRELFADLRAWWDRLLGRKRRETSVVVETPQPAGPTFRSFSSYPDPFLTSAAGRYTPEQLVRYSFEAFEAWARERGAPRHPEQTPHEFALHVGNQNANVSQSARALAELYSRLAYASGPLPPSSVEHLKQLWAALRASV
jgi:hypothetical protein